MKADGQPCVVAAGLPGVLDGADASDRAGDAGPVSATLGDLGARKSTRRLVAASSDHRPRAW